MNSKLLCIKPEAELEDYTYGAYTFLTHNMRERDDNFDSYVLRQHDVVIEISSYQLAPGFVTMVQVLTKHGVRWIQSYLLANAV